MLSSWRNCMLFCPVTPIVDRLLDMTQPSCDIKSRGLEADSKWDVPRGALSGPVLQSMKRVLGSTEEDHRFESPSSSRFLFMVNPSCHIDRDLLPRRTS